MATMFWFIGRLLFTPAQWKPLLICDLCGGKNSRHKVTSGLAEREEKSVEFFLTVNNFLKRRPPHSITSKSLGSTLFSICYCCSPVSLFWGSLGCLVYKRHRCGIGARPRLVNAIREVNALHLHPACRESPSLIHLNVSDATFVCLAQPPCESQQALTSVASGGPAARLAHQSSAVLEKKSPKAMKRLSDDAVSLTWDDQQRKSINCVLVEDHPV